MIPDRFPAVTIACLDPCKACPTLHTNDGSNDQSVASNPVRSSRARPVFAFFPMPASRTVTEANPVACRLAACITLKPGTLVDHACVTLPDQFHTVILAHFDLCTLGPVHLTDMSETQSVTSPQTCCNISRDWPVYAIIPMLASCTVIEANPVAYQLTACITLKPNTYVDHVSVTLPDRIPAITIFRLIPACPAPSCTSAMCLRPCLSSRIH